jgi:hypothetical protein
VHAAPPVRVTLGRHWGWPVCVGVFVGAAAGNLVAWCLLAWDVQGALPAAFVSAISVGAMACWRTHRSQAVGELLWDGAQWQWRGSAGQAHVAIDLNGWMLLRFEPSTGPQRWMAASRAMTVGPWPALRAALYSRRPADPLDVPPA